jgi:alpha,alpha-trehalose phosphorylase
MSAQPIRKLRPIPPQSETGASSRGGSGLPTDPWRLVEDAFDPSANLLRETLFALANGHIGTRGSHDEGWSGDASASMEGTYINGFYETEAIRYPETAYGLARTNEFMLNVPNAKGVAIVLDGEAFDLTSGTLLAYERSLDFRDGVLVRSVDWRSPAGKVVRIVSKRLVSLTRSALLAQETTVTPLGFSGTIELTTTLDGRVRNVEAGDDPRFGSAGAGSSLRTIEAAGGAGRACLVARTVNSGLTLHVETVASLTGGRKVVSRRSDAGDVLAETFRLDLADGETVRLCKLTAYLTSRDHPAEALGSEAGKALDSAGAAGFAGLAAEQRQALAAFWSKAEIDIEGDDALSQGLHFNLFHLFQSIGRDGRTNIAAKGLTGEGYEGHSFWDTEIYIQPVFLRTLPELARGVIAHRIGYLDKARQRARALGHARGALYPWRTITGEECSAYFPAGTAQYHINADIAYAIAEYVGATGDRSLLLEGGAELVFETARVWADLAHLRDGSYHIDEVTGPDEYTALVNDNFYTNVMARTHLAFAADVAGRLGREAPEVFAGIATRIGLDEAEVGHWAEVAEKILLPYDEKLGIHAQDDAFLARKIWDFDNTPAENYPLLLHYHPLVIYRHQVCKQADVVLALLLRGDLFTRDEKRRDFDYYEAVTTHDSSLSSCIHSILAAEVGYREKAYDFFMETARMDIDNTHGNTFHGVHTAAMGGTWMCVVNGFAGFRSRKGGLHFSPYLPRGWASYRFRLVDHGRTIEVVVGKASASYRLIEGGAIRLHHEGRPVDLTPAAPDQAMPLAAASVRKPYKAIIFDLDGVITDTARFHHLAWKRLADSLGIGFDEELAESLKGIDRKNSLRLILEKGGKTVPPDEFDRLASQKNDWYKELIGTMTRDDLLPGAVEALRAASAAGLGIGLASVSQNAPTILGRLGIADMFDTVVDARLLAHGKPDPEIFLKAAAALGVAPADCLGVEDAVSGVASIKAAGMTALGIGEATVLTEADAVIAGLDRFVLDDYLAR